MSRLLIPNLCFEEELSGGTRISVPAQQRVDELAPCMGLLAATKDNESSDIVCVGDDAVPGPLPPLLQNVSFCPLSRVSQHSTCLTAVRPWGWSLPVWKFLGAALPSAARSGISVAPAPDAVREVNGRRFQVRHERVVRISASHSNSSPPAIGHICDSLKTVQRILDVFIRETRTKDCSWVIKAEFSQAARNRLTGHGTSLSPQHVRWLEQRFSSGEVVCVERWVNRISEIGVQFEIPPFTDAGPHQDVRHAGPGTTMLIGAAEMISARGGQYRGSVIQSAEAKIPQPWTQILPVAQEIAQQIAAAGYWGPVGLDCMLFQEADGSQWVRVGHDVNARLTMGRVALQLRSELRSGETAAWCHVPLSGDADEISNDAQILFEGGCADGVRIVPTSPRTVGGRNVSVTTALLISQCQRSLMQRVSRMFESSRSPRNSH
ncbi:MAG: hypothetical protein KDA96_04275 [Planctomycetaceae bacterium]|nr:hypothetical protein [Planctomycetaceae bacterium]